jgi:hypothetical protein
VLVDKQINFFAPTFEDKRRKTRATQSVAYPLAVKPLKNSKFNCDLDL